MIKVNAVFIVNFNVALNFNKRKDSYKIGHLDDDDQLSNTLNKCLSKKNFYSLEENTKYLLDTFIACLDDINELKFRLHLLYPLI